jgi:hypothetical protein
MFSETPVDFQQIKRRYTIDIHIDTRWGKMPDINLQKHLQYTRIARDLLDSRIGILNRSIHQCDGYQHQFVT